MHHLAHGDFLAVVEEVRQVLMHVSAKIQVSALGQDRDRHRRELLADGAGPEYCLRCDWNVMLHVRKAIAGFMNELAVVDDANGTPWLVVVDIRKDRIDVLLQVRGGECQEWK
jgi:hypothetical protein